MQSIQPQTGYLLFKMLAGLLRKQGATFLVAGGSSRGAAALGFRGFRVIWGLGFRVLGF